MTKIGLIIVLFVLSLILVFNYATYNVGNYMIRGIWEAHPSFCEEAGVDRFYIYFDPPTNLCWICMANDKEMLVNHITKFNIRPASLCTNILNPNSLVKDYTVTFEDLPDNLTPDLFPARQQLKIYIDSGKLLLTNTKDNIYFAGYKNCSTSDLLDIGDMTQSDRSDLDQSAEAL